MSDYVRGLQAAQELAERQASESHNGSWNRAVAALVQAIADEIDEADADSLTPRNVTEPEQIPAQAR